jgi:hypothetical protein
MIGTAEMAAGSIPYFLETGQNLIQDLSARPELVSADSAELGRILDDSLRVVPFFNQLSVLDAEGNVLASYPTRHYVGKDAPVDVQMGVQAVFSGIPFQSYSVPPATGQSTAQVAFIAAIRDSAGNARRVLVGHSGLGANPLIQPTLAGLKSLEGRSGCGRNIWAKPSPASRFSMTPARMARARLYTSSRPPDGTGR